MSRGRSAAGPMVALLLLGLAASCCADEGGTPAPRPGGCRARRRAAGVLGAARPPRPPPCSVHVADQRAGIRFPPKLPPHGLQGTPPGGLSGVVCRCWHPLKVPRSPLRRPRQKEAHEGVPRFLRVNQSRGPGLRRRLGRQSGRRAGGQRHRRRRLPADVPRPVPGGPAGVEVGRRWVRL